jgi:phosphoglycolate phosphatase-like HAD superfamily hydrolase
MRKLVLWDVDGTLLHTDGIAGEMMRAAMAQVFGPVTRRERTFYSGKTDWRIIQDSFPDLAPEAIAENLKLFGQAYADGIGGRRDDLIARSGTMPGVVEVLQQLHGQVAQAPLTGNIIEVARIKLEVLNLLPYLNIDVGAYGDDHHDRHALVPIAAERAAKVYGHAFSGQDVVIVGDTPNDVACGRANGARTVIVATGAYTYEQLQPHAPDVLLHDLSDVEAAVVAILGGGG